MSRCSVVQQYAITTRNQWFQRLINLRDSRRRRHRDRLLFVEGVTLINALSDEWRVVALASPARKRLSEWTETQVTRLAPETRLLLDEALFDEVSTKEDASSELIAIIGAPPLDGVRLPVDHTVLLMDRPSSHGNFGTILRAADAFGAGGVVMTGHAIDPFDPRTLRASAGSFFRVPVARLDGAALTGWLDETGATLVGTTAWADEQLGDAVLPVPMVLAFGNEKSGLSERLKARCDRLIGIEMAGYATSLNVANMVSICLYEARRQQRDGA